MGSNDPPNSFTQTFLLDGETDLPMLRAVDSSEIEARKKRAHRKSRWGCMACKRRKVKCDENVPCNNCEKRRETCSLVTNKPPTPAATPPLTRELDPLPGVDARANLMHMELFYHYTQVTSHTLAFATSGAEVVQISFHEEYLMTAILAVSARHLTILNPSSRRYSDAALILFSKSCSQLRAELDEPLTLENRDARLATSILLHYLSWCDVEFLGPWRGAHDRRHRHGRRDDDVAPDLARDPILLLGNGMRHVRFLSWQLPDLEDSLFGRLLATRKCCSMRSLIEGSEQSYRALRERIMGLYHDPRLGGSGRRTTPPRADEGPLPEDGLPSNFSGVLPAPCSQYCSSTHIPQLLALRAIDNGERTPASRMLYNRLSFEVAVERLAILVFAARLHELGGDLAIATRERDELERSVLSFPLLCFGPFCELVAAGDARALAVLYLMYRSAGILMEGARCPWWAAERIAVMRPLLGGELRRRGLLALVEDICE